MVVMGIIEGFRSDLGVECGGIVRRIGKTVQDVAVGDRVMIFHHGCFSTTFIALATQLVKIPDSLSFEEAATMPCVYTTVIQALINVGNLSKDQVSHQSNYPSQIHQTDPSRLSLCIQHAAELALPPSTYVK